MGAKTTVVPFGPQHPALLEPWQLCLVLEDEKVVEAMPAMGYMHRGLETLVAKRDYQQMLYVAQRITGLSSFAYAMAYAMAVEELQGMTIPPRAAYLRVIWSELSRLQSHLFWLGSFANSIGLENLQMLCLRVREQVLDVIEDVSGNRLLANHVAIGGLTGDVGVDGLAKMRNLCDFGEGALAQIRPVLLDNYGLKRRTVGIGVLSKEKAQEFGVVGPVMRASGIVQDMRQQGYAAYDELQFVPAAESDGDCYARMLVRFNEMVEAIGPLRSAMVKIPTGECADASTGQGLQGETVVRVEEPRGELLLYLSGDGSPYLRRMQVRSPSHANLAALLATLPGSQLADVPVIISSFDLTVSCIER